MIHGRPAPARYLGTRLPVSLGGEFRLGWWRLLASSRTVGAGARARNHAQIRQVPETTQTTIRRTVVRITQSLVAILLCSAVLMLPGSASAQTADTPTPPEFAPADAWQIDDPDLVVRFPAYTVPDAGPDIFGNLFTEFGLDEDRYITSIQHQFPPQGDCAQAHPLFEAARGLAGSDHRRPRYSRWRNRPLGRLHAVQQGGADHDVLAAYAHAG